MTVRGHWGGGRRWAGALGGLVGLALLTVGSASANHAVPGAAPANCNQPNWTIGVAFLGLQTAQNLVLVDTNGVFQGQAIVAVLCYDGIGNSIGVVPHSIVQIYTTVPGTTVNGQAATSPSSASVDVPDGKAMITIATTTPNLPTSEWFAKVGTDNVIVTQAFGQSVPNGSSPTMIGNLWAQTPELGSLALFGAGVAGMAGYALTRLRARRRA